MSDPVDVFRYAQAVQLMHPPILDCPPRQRHASPRIICHEQQLDDYLSIILERLPREIIMTILTMLDIPVLTNLGRGSSLAMAMIKSLHDWQAVATNALRIITVAQSTNARYFSLGEVCDILFNDGAPCTSCHRQGFYIYLITRK